MPDPIAPDITAKGVEDYIGSSSYTRVTNNNDDTVALTAINRSRIWCKSKFDKAGRNFDETDVNTAESVLNMACYFLFYRNNQVKAGNHYKKLAMELLKSTLGNDALGEEDTDGPSSPGLTVTEGTTYVYGDDYGNGSYGPYTGY